MNRIVCQKDGDGCRVTVESDRLDADALVFVFTPEGLIIDATTGDQVTGTFGNMFDEIEQGLLGPA